MKNNSIRHAYPEGKGPVVVNLAIDGSDKLKLIVKDYGVGLSETVVPEHADTIGFRLVYMLAVGQLEGCVKINRDNGTTVEIKFERIDDKRRF